MPPKDDGILAGKLQNMENVIGQQGQNLESLREQVVTNSSDLQFLKSTMDTMSQGIQQLLTAQASAPRSPSSGTPTPSRSPTIQPPTPPPPPLHRMMQNVQSAPPHPYKLPKLEFPMFDGTGVRNWLNKARRFFTLNPIQDNLKVQFASMYFSGKADNWFQAEAHMLERLSWELFAAVLTSRFTDDLGNNVVGEFNKLCQQFSVQVYNEEFELLRPLVMQKTSGLTEDYFVASYLSGLKNDIKHVVQMFTPTTVSTAMYLTKLQEANIDSVQRSSKSVLKPKSGSGWSPFSRQSSSPSISTPTPENQKKEAPTSSRPIIKHLTKPEMLSRRKRGLCYNCDDVYSPDHKCKSKQLYLLIDDWDDEEGSQIFSKEAAPTSHQPSPTEVAISIQALSGSASYQTLLLQGSSRNRILSMLVDFGSTHNFLDAEATKEMGCSITTTDEHTVTIVGGGQLQCKGICKQFQWEVHGVRFCSDV